MLSLETAAFALLLLPAFMSTLTILPIKGKVLFWSLMAMLFGLEGYLLVKIIASQSIIIRTIGLQDSGLGLELKITTLRLFFLVLSNLSIALCSYRLFHPQQTTKSIQQISLLLLLFFPLNGFFLSDSLINVFFCLESLEIIMLALSHLEYKNKTTLAIFSVHLMGSLLLLVLVFFITINFQNIYLEDLAPVFSNYLSYNYEFNYTVIVIFVLIILSKFFASWLLLRNPDVGRSINFAKTLWLFLAPIVAAYLLHIFSMLINSSSFAVNNPALGRFLILPILMVLCQQIWLFIDSRKQVKVNYVDHFAILYQLIIFLGLGIDSVHTLNIARLLLVEYILLAPPFLLLSQEGLTALRLHSQNGKTNPVYTIIILILGLNLLAAPFTLGFHILFTALQEIWLTTVIEEQIFLWLTILCSLAKILFGFKLLADCTNAHTTYSLSQLLYLGIGGILTYGILIKFSEIVSYYLNIM